MDPMQSIRNRLVACETRLDYHEQDCSSLAAGAKIRRLEKELQVERDKVAALQELADEGFELELDPRMERKVKRYIDRQLQQMRRDFIENMKEELKQPARPPMFPTASGASSSKSGEEQEDQHTAAQLVKEPTSPTIKPAEGRRTTRSQSRTRAMIAPAGDTTASSTSRPAGKRKAEALGTIAEMEAEASMPLPKKLR